MLGKLNSAIQVWTKDCPCKSQFVITCDRAGMKRSDLPKMLASEPRKRKSAFDRALQKSRNTPERAEVIKASDAASADSEIVTLEPHRKPALRNVIDLDSEDEDDEFDRWKNRRFDRLEKPGLRQKQGQAEQPEAALSHYTEIRFNDTAPATQTPPLQKDRSGDDHSCDGQSTERSQRPTARLPEVPIERLPSQGPQKVSFDQMAQMCIKTKLDAIQTTQEKDNIIQKLEERCRSLVAASEETAAHLNDARLQVVDLTKSVTGPHLSAGRSASFPSVNSERRGDDAAIPLLMEAKRFWESVESSNLKAGLVGKINMKFLQLCRDRDILKKDNKSLRTSLQKMLLKNLVDRIDENMRESLNDYSEMDIADEGLPSVSDDRLVSASEERFGGPRDQQQLQEPAQSLQVSVVSSHSQKSREEELLDRKTPVESFTEVVEAGELPESLDAAVQWSEAAMARIREDRERALELLDRRAIELQTELRQQHEQLAKSRAIQDAAQNAARRQLVEPTPVQTSHLERAEEISASVVRSPSLDSAFHVTVTVSRGRDFPTSGYRSVPTRILCCVSVLENSGDVEAHHKLLVAHSVPGAQSNHASSGGTSEHIQPQQQGREVPFNADPEWNETFTIKSALCGTSYQAGKRVGAVPRERGRVKKPLLGSEMLLLVTLHGICEADTELLIARLVLPIRPGSKSADWFMVLSADGYPLVGETGRQSCVYLEATFAPEQHSSLPVELPCIPMHSKETALALTQFSEEDSCGISMSIPAHLSRFQSNPEVFVEHFLRDIADAMSIARDRLQYSGMTRASATMMFNLLPDDNHAHSSQTPLSLSVALMVMMSDPGSRLRQLHSTKQCEKLIVHGPVPKVLEDIRVMMPRTAAEQHKRLMDLEWRLTALESDELQKMWKKKRAGMDDDLEPVTIEVLFEPTSMVLLSGGTWPRSPAEKRYQESPSFRRRLSVESQASVTQFNWMEKSVASSRSLSLSGTSEQTDEIQSVSMLSFSIEDVSWREGALTPSRTPSRQSWREGPLTPFSVDCLFQPQKDHQFILTQQWSPRGTQQWSPPEPKRLAGVGLSLMQETNENSQIQVCVRKVIRGSAADLCGRVLQRDVLLAVDGRDVQGKLQDIVQNLLIGEEGTSVSLQLKRADDWAGRTMYTVSLVRGSLQGSIITQYGSPWTGTGTSPPQLSASFSREGTESLNDSGASQDAIGSRTLSKPPPLPLNLDTSLNLHTLNLNKVESPRRSEDRDSGSRSPEPRVLAIVHSNRVSQQSPHGSPRSSRTSSNSMNGPESPCRSTSPSMFEFKHPEFRRGSEEHAGFVNRSASPTMPRVLSVSPRRLSAVSDENSPQNRVPVLVNIPLSQALTRPTSQSPINDSPTKPTSPIYDSPTRPTSHAPMYISPTKPTSPVDYSPTKPTFQSPIYDSPMRQISQTYVQTYESPTRSSIQSHESPRHVDTSPRYDISPRHSPTLRYTEAPAVKPSLGHSLPRLPLSAVIDKPVTQNSAAAPSLKLPPTPQYDAFGLVNQSPRLDEPSLVHYPAPTTPRPSPERGPVGTPPRIRQDPVTMRVAATLETTSPPAVPLPGRERQEERKAVHSSRSIESGGEWRVDSLIVEACGLVRLHGVGQPNLFCKVSVGAAGGDTAWQEQAAQHVEEGGAKQTEVVMGTMEPVWRKMFSFGNESSEKDKSGDASWRKIAGQALQLMVTVHDMMGSTSAFRGMVLVPVLAGLSEDCWYTLQNRDGSHMYGPNGQPSRIRIQTHYWQPPPSLPPLSLPISPLAFLPPVPRTEAGSILSVPCSRSSMIIKLPTGTVSSDTEDVVVTASLTPRNFYDSPRDQRERIITPKLDRQRSSPGSTSRYGQPSASIPPIARPGWHQSREEQENRSTMRWSSASGSSDTLGYGGDLSSYSIECL